MWFTHIQGKKPFCWINSVFSLQAPSFTTGCVLLYRGGSFEVLMLFAGLEKACCSATPRGKQKMQLLGNLSLYITESYQIPEACKYSYISAQQ